MPDVLLDRRPKQVTIVARPDRPTSTALEVNDISDLHLNASHLGGKQCFRPFVH